MYVIVKRLRQAGKRRSDSEISADDGHAGEITLSAVGPSYVARLSPLNDTSGTSLIPELFEARVVTIHTDKMLFRGEERPQGAAGPAIVQEWSVMVVLQTG